MGNKTGLLVAILIVAVLALFGVGYLLANQPAPVNVPTASQIASLVTVPALNTSNLATKADIAVLKVDTNFKAQVKKLATDEFTQKSYKAVFNELSNIDSRKDISSVVVDKQSVSGVDAENGNAEVVQKITVKYEDSDGQRAKVHFKVTTVISDFEVDDQDFELI